MRKCIVIGLLILGARISRAQTATVNLAWDPNTEPDLAGYRMHYGPSSRNYTNVTAVGNVTTNTVLGLINGVTYYFAVTAYNTEGFESDFSNEVNFTPAATNQVNFPPTLDPLSDLVINEDAGPQTVTLTGITSGSSNEVQTLAVTAVSSSPALIPNPTITYTSPNTTGTLSFTPLPNANGTAIISVTVDDGSGSSNLLTRSFTVTVNAVNDPPTLNPINDLVLSANAGLQTVLLSGISSGAPNEIQTLSVTASSSNPALIPNPTVTYVSPTTSGTVVFTPAANATGTANIIVTVDDGGTGNATFARSFNVAVNAAVPNTPPLISVILAQTIQKNQSTGPLPFIIADAETPAANLALSASSSNTNLVPTSQIVFGGSSSNRTATVTPLRRKTGTSLITISVSDGTLTASSPFLLTVTGNGGLTVATAGTSLATADLSRQSLPATADSSPQSSVFKILSISQQPITSADSSRQSVLATAEAATILITWQSNRGSTYRVLYKNALDDPAWLDASSDIIANDTTTSWNDQVEQGTTSRYYCVLLVQ